MHHLLEMSVVVGPWDGADTHRDAALFTTMSVVVGPWEEADTHARAALFTASGVVQSLLLQG